MRADRSSSHLVYRSLVTVEADRGREKHAVLPIDGKPVVMGVNDEVAAHYGIPEGAYTPHATSLDYVVAAAAACLTGTFGGALEALGQPIADGNLTAEAIGDIEVEDNVLVIRRILVRYLLRLEEGVGREAVERAHRSHLARCPVARSIGGCIPIETELVVE